MKGKPITREEFSAAMTDFARREGAAAVLKVFADYLSARSYHHGARGDEIAASIFHEQAAHIRKLARDFNLIGKVSKLARFQPDRKGQ